ncbi:MAG: threonine--tRNA ligase [Promethearchaeota archaeon]
MHKLKVATSTPQEFDGDKMDVSGQVLVALMSIEDQDTFDVNLIANQAVDVILEAKGMIEGFPAKIKADNEEIKKYNENLKKGGKPRVLKELILPEDQYRVDSVMVYPWAHLSKFLSKDKNAMDVFPRVVEILKEKGIEAAHSPFGWYKAFNIKCLGHELAEMYRDVKLAIQPTEHHENTRFLLASPSGELLEFTYSSKGKVKYPGEIQGKEFKDLRDFLGSEVSKKKREDSGKEPGHIKYMQKFELVDFDKNTDKGNLRWYTNGVIMKNLIKQHIMDNCIDFGVVMVDTPIMYTVQNKRLTAQTARFPARTYWVISGKNRFLLRFAGDFLQFSMFEEMNLLEKYLPLRLYEYEKLDFRREQAGEVIGIQRLRAFHMPDLHTLCKDLPAAIDEFQKQYELDSRLMGEYGLKSYNIYRTTEKFFEQNRDWIMKQVADAGEYALIQLWEERYYYFVLKFEKAILSEANKSSTLATIQIDVESSLDFIEEAGKKTQKYNIKVKCRDGSEIHPIILHNAPAGGVERIIWGMLESNIRNITTHVVGFPFWVSPVQVRVLPVKDTCNERCEEIMVKLNRLGFRADFDDRSETLGKKIRQAGKDWIPYVIIIGEDELKTSKISVRKRLTGEVIDERKGFEEIKDISLNNFIKILRKEIEGYPRHKLPVPFRKLTTKVSFR